MTCRFGQYTAMGAIMFAGLATIGSVLVINRKNKLSKGTKPKE